MTGIVLKYRNFGYPDGVTVVAEILAFLAVVAMLQKIHIAAVLDDSSNPSLFYSRICVVPCKNYR